MLAPARDQEVARLRTSARDGSPAGGLPDLTFSLCSALVHRTCVRTALGAAVSGILAGSGTGAGLDQEKADLDTSMAAAKGQVGSWALLPVLKLPAVRLEASRWSASLLARKILS